MANLTRRDFLAFASGSLLGLGCLPLIANASFPHRLIPKSQEKISPLGMGTWQTFAIDDDVEALQTRIQILQAFYDNGGMLIDSSPMYGSSEATLGKCLPQVKNKTSHFSATKVWTQGWQSGVRQMERSRQLWGGDRFDLMQIHNLLDYETHIEMLKAWKKQGKVRYIGITTSHGRRHEDMLTIMENEPALDFVQFTYNILDREAEKYLLPLAQKKQLAVIINMPFDKGGLFRRVTTKALPGWAADLAIQNWAQYFLKFIISHPAVTVAIPATSRVDHMQQNMGALQGKLPTAKQRDLMRDYFLN